MENKRSDVMTVVWDISFDKYYYFINGVSFLSKSFLTLYNSDLILIETILTFNNYTYFNYKIIEK